MKYIDVKRLIIEYNDLLIRSARLKKYLDHNIEHLEVETAELMIKQFKVMHIYLLILTNRLNDLHIKVKIYKKERCACYEYNNNLIYLETDKLKGE